MMLAAFKPVESGMRKTDLLREFGVGEAGSFFPQKRCELPFQMSPHALSMAERS